MSFGGVQHAISVMKQNRNLIKKHRKKCVGLAGDDSKITEYNLPKITEQKILMLRKKLQQEQKLRRTKQVVVLSVVMLILIGTLIYYM